MKTRFSILIYDPVTTFVQTLDGESCWNVNAAKRTISTKPCHPKIRQMDSKQAFHVMKADNGTVMLFEISGLAGLKLNFNEKQNIAFLFMRALVPGGQFAGECVGHILEDEMYRNSIKAVGLFDCSMFGFELQLFV